jgi:translation elongation factor P/translation initiation factor 5A
VIKTASLTIIVDDPSLAVTAISNMAEGMGGFVVSSNVYQTSQVGDQKIYYGSVTIRVPATKLNTALDQIRAQVKNLKTDVVDENISGEDVTSTVVDLESRLKNYQATQTQLLKFMDKATKTQDALDVLQQLTSVQEQIELLQGQIKYYNESAAMSAITVTVQPNIPVQPVTVEGWKPLQILRDATQTLVDIFKGLFTFLAYVIIIFGPFVLIFFFIYWLVWLSRKKKGWVRKGLKFYPPGTQFTPPTLPASHKKKVKK